MSAPPDRWSQWLLGRRDADDEDQRAASLRHLAPIRDRVLDAAEPLSGLTLLDVGTGDGLIGLGALDRVGPGGHVIFADVSAALLAAARAAVAEPRATDRASFVELRAEDLAPIADASVDVVTTRSVLIYVADKLEALKAMRRVLRPGGTISLFEPINRLMFPEPGDRFWGYDVAAVAELAEQVKAAYRGLESPATASMTDFDDRDLVRLAEEAGFEQLHLETHTDVGTDPAAQSVSLDALLDSAPNPLAPTVRECVDAALTGPEDARFLAELGRSVAERRHVRRSVVAYLTGRCPPIAVD